MILITASANPSHWGDVSHGGQHRNATMLDLGGATSLEVLHASIGGKSGGIPETHGRLHAEFILEGAQRRCCVVGPVSPGASGQTILGHGSYGGGNIEIVDNSINIIVWHYVIQYDRI